MTEYRTNITKRAFWKLDNKSMTSVLITQQMAKIEYCEAYPYAQLITEDTASYLPCTADEFNKAYKEALAIVTIGKIV